MPLPVSIPQRAAGRGRNSLCLGRGLGGHTDPMRQTNGESGRHQAPRYGVPPEDALPRAREFAAELASRRAIRDFSDEPLPFGVLAGAVRAAASAPSGANVQPWRFVIVTDPATKTALRQAAEAEA